MANNREMILEKLMSVSLTQFDVKDRQKDFDDAHRAFLSAEKALSDAADLNRMAFMAAVDSAILEGVPRDAVMEAVSKW